MQLNSFIYTIEFKTIVSPILATNTISMPKNYFKIITVQLKL